MTNLSEKGNIDEAPNMYDLRACLGIFNCMWRWRRREVAPQI